MAVIGYMRSEYIRVQKVEKTIIMAWMLPLWWSCDTFTCFRRGK